MCTRFPKLDALRILNNELKLANNFNTNEKHEIIQSIDVIYSENQLDKLRI